MNKYGAYSTVFIVQLDCPAQQHSSFPQEEHLRRALGSLPSFLPPSIASPSSGWPSLFSPTTYLLLQASQFCILTAQLPDFTSAFLT